jgi:hypothetical protein
MLSAVEYKSIKNDMWTQLASSVCPAAASGDDNNHNKIIFAFFYSRLFQVFIPWTSGRSFHSPGSLLLSVFTGHNIESKVAERRLDTRLDVAGGGSPRWQRWRRDEAAAGSTTTADVMHVAILLVAVPLFRSSMAGICWQGVKIAEHVWTFKLFIHTCVFLRHLGSVGLYHAILNEVYCPQKSSMYRPSLEGDCIYSTLFLCRIYFLPDVEYIYQALTCRRSPGYLPRRRGLLALHHLPFVPAMACLPTHDG